MTQASAAKTAILVAGMHRSGTSALTRVLNLVGCDLPGTLVAPKPDNVAGFWESQAVVDLNQAILSSAGSAWDDWRPFDPDWYASPVAAPFRERAPQVLQQEFGDSRLFILKDPRICRLLPFWIEAARTFGARIAVVVPIRNPLDVGSSMESRNDLNPFVGYLTWLRHVLDAEAGSRDVTRVFVRYEQLLSDAHACVDRLGRVLGVPWPKGSSPATQMAIEEFLAPDLTHHRSDDARLLANPRISPWIRSCFTIVDRWAQGVIRDGDSAELDQIRVAFDAAAPAFSRALAATQKQKRALAFRLDAMREELAARDGRIGGLTNRLDTARRMAAESNERIATLSEAVEQRERRIAALLGSTSWRLTAPVRALGSWLGSKGRRRQAP